MTLATACASMRESGLCKKCAAVLFANIGDVPGEVEIDVAAKPIARDPHGSPHPELGVEAKVAAHEMADVLDLVLHHHQP